MVDEVAGPLWNPVFSAKRALEELGGGMQDIMEVPGFSDELNSILFTTEGEMVTPTAKLVFSHSAMKNFPVLKYLGVLGPKEEGLAIQPDHNLGLSVPGMPTHQKFARMTDEEKQRMKEEVLGLRPQKPLTSVDEDGEPVFYTAEPGELFEGHSAGLVTGLMSMAIVWEGLGGPAPPAPKTAARNVMAHIKEHSCQRDLDKRLIEFFYWASDLPGRESSSESEGSDTGSDEGSPPYGRSDGEPITFD